MWRDENAPIWTVQIVSAREVKGRGRVHLNVATNTALAPGGTRSHHLALRWGVRIKICVSRSWHFTKHMAKLKNPLISWMPCTQLIQRWYCPSKYILGNIYLQFRLCHIFLTAMVIKIKMETLGNRVRPRCLYSCLLWETWPDSSHTNHPVKATLDQMSFRKDIPAVS